jgi:predicted nucleic acid-binding protein
MSLIVDASVAVKWLSEEPGSAQAEVLLAGVDDLIAPELVLAEIGNALWKKAVARILDRRQMLDGIQRVPAFFDRLVPVPEIATRATEIALDLRHPVYDCFYLALAERERCSLITADKRLLSVAKKMKGIEVQKL